MSMMMVFVIAIMIAAAILSQKPRRRSVTGGDYGGSWGSGGDSGVDAGCDGGSADGGGCGGD